MPTWSVWGWEWLTDPNSDNAAGVQVVIAVLGLVAAGMVLYATLRATNAALSQSSIAQEQYERSLEPVLAFDTSSLVPEDEPSNRYQFEVGVTNYGTGPALRVQAEATLSNSPT